MTINGLFLRKILWNMLGLLCNTTQAADNNEVLSEENKRLVWKFSKTATFLSFYERNQTTIITSFYPKSPWNGPIADSLGNPWMATSTIFNSFLEIDPYLKMKEYYNYQNVSPFVKFRRYYATCVFMRFFFINYSYLYNWSNKEMRCSLFQNIFQLTVQTLTKYSSVALLNWTSLSSRELLNIVYDLNFIQARV